MSTSHTEYSAYDTSSTNKPIENPTQETKRYTFKIIKRRNPWTQSEDSAIISLVNKYGTNNWTTIATEMSNYFKSQSRNGKQCRERWHNHLDPNINKEYWTENEEEILFNKHKEFGNKWSDIAKYLPGRTDNSIKNHFYSKVRKYIRKLLKQIQYEDLMKINGIDSSKYNGEKIYKLLKKCKIDYKNLTKEMVIALIIKYENSNMNNKREIRMCVRKVKRNKSKSNKTNNNGNKNDLINNKNCSLENKSSGNMQHTLNETFTIKGNNYEDVIISSTKVNVDVMDDNKAEQMQCEIKKNRPAFQIHNKHSFLIINKQLFDNDNNNNLYSNNSNNTNTIKFEPTLEHSFSLGLDNKKTKPQIHINIINSCFPEIRLSLNEQSLNKSPFQNITPNLFPHYHNNTNSSFKLFNHFHNPFHHPKDIMNYPHHNHFKTMLEMNTTHSSNTITPNLNFIPHNNNTTFPFQSKQLFNNELYHCNINNLQNKMKPHHVNNLNTNTN